MHSLDLIKTQFGEKFTAAIKEGDEKALTDAIIELASNTQTSIIEDAMSSKDNTILASRGVRVLTSAETKYYNALIGAMKSPDPKATLTKFDVTMPETIIDAVMDDLESEFPLLAEVNLVNTTALTKMIINKQGIQSAVWGALGSSIATELNGSFDEINVTQCKLTAFMAISKDFLALGPQWLDKYTRTILAESIGYGLTTAIVSGNGVSKPIGMAMDLDNGTTTSGVTTYSQKTAVTLNKITPKTYGDIIATISKTPSNRDRIVQEVIFVVNPKTYLTKVLPAITMTAPDGSYQQVFPFPTKVIQTIGIDDNKAIIGIGKNYFMGLGTSKEGLISYSDEFRFLDDERVYTAKLLGNGRPIDNKSFIVADITNLEERTLNVNVKDGVTVNEVKGTVKTKEQSA